MDEETKVLLIEEIKTEFDSLARLDDSAEKTAAIDNLVKLYKLKIEEEKAEMDLDAKIDAKDSEIRFKMQQLEDQKEARNREFDFKYKQLDEQKEARNGDLGFKKEQLDEQKTARGCDFDLRRDQFVEQKDTRKSDEAFKQEQLAEQRRDRYIRLGVAAAELLIPLVFYGCWMRRGFKFEEQGTFTSTTFRGLFNRFRPTKN